MPRKQLIQAAEELRAELDEIEDLDPERRARLEAVTEQLEALADGREGLSDLREDIEHRAQEFAATHPKLEPILRRVALALTGLGF